MFRNLFSGFNHVGSALQSMSRAQAQWELEMSRTIFARRKKWLALALAPILLMSIWSWVSAQTAPAPLPDSTPAAVSADSQPASAAATSATPSKPLPNFLPDRGGSKAYMPSRMTSNMFFGSIFVGLIAGLITGVIGAGGGYILTPALMSFGVKGIMAVGTDQFHLFAKAIMGTTIHRKLGNVSLWLAVWFVVGSLGGVTLGGHLNRKVFLYSPALSDAMISSVYVIVLGFLGLYAIIDYLRLRKSGPARSSAEATTSFARALQRLPLWPRVRFDEAIVPGGRTLCVYPIIVCGFIVGFVAAIMGVGGGFLTFPMFVYGLGVSTFTTVGTDILQIIFTAGYSSIKEYALYGYVFYSVAVMMLVGSLIGVQFGAMVTNVVKGSTIRAFFALTILAGFFNRVCALPRKLADLGFVSISTDTGMMIENAGVVLFFGTVIIFAVWIIIVFLLNLNAMRNDADGHPLPKDSPLIADPRRFALGIAGIVIFSVLLVWGTLPSSAGTNKLDSSDEFFNQLAKDGAYFIPGAQKKIAPLADVTIDIGFAPRHKIDLAKVASVLADSGCEITFSQEDPPRPRIHGKLGNLAKTALADAELAFHNDDATFEKDHHLNCRQVMYCWWIVFDGLSNRYVHDNRGNEAEATRFVATKVMEPAYNFCGIQAKPIRNPGNALQLAGFLGFYVLYTLWYGFSILLVMEGLGIRMEVAKIREES